MSDCKHNIKESKITVVGYKSHSKVVEEYFWSKGFTVKTVNIGFKRARYRYGDYYFVAIGNNKERKKIVARIDKKFGRIYNENTYIAPSSFVNIGCKIGFGVIVNSMACIEHDCKLGDYSHVASNATLAGNVTVGEGTLIGTGAVVLPNIKIGAWSIIGAGSVVTKDVKAKQVVKGNPAK